MKIGKFSIPNSLILAPLAGYTDVGMRTLCLKYGAAFCYTEMVSAKGLYYKNENTKSLLYTANDETIKAVQLFSDDAEILGLVCASEDLEKFDIIDLNCGCPVPKVVRNGEGSALTQDPEKIYRLIRAMKTAAPNKAITCKIRLGFKKNDFTAIEVAKAVEEAGGDMLTVHGRTREDYFSGEVDYDKIARVKESVAIPVVGNGDVVDELSYNKMKATGVDGVMIGRGALGRPYIFSKLQDKPYDFKLKDTILEHIAKLREILPDRVVANNMKTHIAFYLKGIKDAKPIKMAVFAATNLQEIFDIIDSIKG